MDSGIQIPVSRSRWLDSKPAEIDTAKEMEETPKVPADHDQGRFRSQGGTPRLAQDGPMAIGDETAGAVCDEPEMVQGAWISVSA